MSQLFDFSILKKQPKEGQEVKCSCCNNMTTTPCTTISETQNCINYKKITDGKSQPFILKSSKINNDTT